MLKQPACAAASSSSGFDPFLPSKRVPKLNEPLNTPLCALKLPLPSLSLPSQTATALLVAMIDCSDGYRGTGNLARHPAVRYASRPFRSAPDGDQEEAGGQEAAPSQSQRESPPPPPPPPRRPAAAGNAAPARHLTHLYRDRPATQHRLLSRRAGLRYGRGVARERHAGGLRDARRVGDVLSHPGRFRQR